MFHQEASVETIKMIIFIVLLAMAVFCECVHKIDERTARSSPLWLLLADSCSQSKRSRSFSYGCSNPRSWTKTLVMMRTKQVELIFSSSLPKSLKFFARAKTLWSTSSRMAHIPTTLLACTSEPLEVHVPRRPYWHQTNVIRITWSSLWRQRARPRKNPRNEHNSSSRKWEFTGAFELFNRISFYNRPASFTVTV